MNVWYMMSKEVRMLWYIVYVLIKYVSIYKIWQKEKGYLSEVKKRLNYVRLSKKKLLKINQKKLEGIIIKVRKLSF